MYLNPPNPPLSPSLAHYPLHVNMVDLFNKEPSLAQVELGFGFFRFRILPTVRARISALGAY